LANAQPADKLAGPESRFARAIGARNRPLRSRVSWGTQRPFRAPNGFFCADVLLHQFGDDLVLLLELVLQASDLFLLDRELVGGTFGNGMEGGLHVVEQNLLPSVDLIRLDPVLVTEVRNGHFIDQIPLENGRLLVRAKASSLLLMESSSFGL